MMNFRDMIAVAGGWAIPLAVLGVGAVSAFMIYGKVKDGKMSIGNQALQMEIEEKKQKIKELNKQISLADSRLAERRVLEEKVEKLIVMKDKLRELRESNLAAKSKLASLDKGLADTVEMFDQYKQRYRIHIRSQAAGTKMRTLTTLSGQTYQQVEIKAIGALGMNITHGEGSCRIPFKELPLEMQRVYQFNEEEADAQQKKEAELRRKRRAALEASIETAEQQNPPEVDERELRRLREERDQAIENLNAAIKNTKALISQAQANMRAEQNKTISRAPQYRLEIERLNKVLQENEARLRELRAMR